MQVFQGRMKNYEHLGVYGCLFQERIHINHIKGGGGGWGGVDCGRIFFRWLFLHGKGGLFLVNYKLSKSHILQCFMMIQKVHPEAHPPPQLMLKSICNFILDYQSFFTLPLSHFLYIQLFNFHFQFHLKVDNFFKK